jgi:signal transduction histidine kinase
LFLIWFVAGYFLTYQLGVAFFYKSASATTLWLSNGFLLAVLLLQTRSRWPLTVSTALITHILIFYSNHPRDQVWGYQTALIDVGEALLAAVIAKRWIHDEFDISRLRHTLTLASAIVVGTAASSVVAAAIITSKVGGPDYWRALRLWWFGDFVGDIVLTPLILAWAHVNYRTVKALSPQRVIEVLALGFVMATVTYESFNVTAGLLPANWLLPVFLWASLRFHPRVVLALLMLATFHAVDASINGFGPFVAAGMPIIDTVISLQSYIAVLSLSMLIVSSLTSDRNRVLELNVAAQKTMKALNADLEDRVAERTVQLEEANRELKLEMAVRADAEAALRARNDELRSFAYTVSHDLKAPLRGVAGYANELEKKHASSLSERASFCLKQILAATHNLDELIEDLLKYSRYDSERPIFVPTNLSLIVERILAERSHEIASRNVNVEINLAVVSLVDWERGLAQTLANLIDNAIKYARHSDPPRIIVSSVQDGDIIAISVADNGIGFDMKYHDRLYGLFNRLVHQDEFEGTGAGLAIAKKLVDKSGGRLWATSRPGHGATFTIEMPVRMPDIVEAQQ